MSNSLSGMNILVTRAEHQAAELNNLIQQSGGNPINLPLQKVRPIPISVHELKHLINEAEWILFTSVNSVEYFVQNITNELNELVSQKKISAVGEKTQLYLEKFGFNVSFIPSIYTGKALATELNENVKKGTKFLFIRGSLASETVPKILSDKFHSVSSLTIYETIPNVSIKNDLIQLLVEKKLDVITFLNPFSIEQFCNLIDGSIKINDLENLKIACIGEVSALAATKKGFKSILVPNKFTIESLIQKIIEDVAK